MIARLSTGLDLKCLVDLPEIMLVVAGVKPAAWLNHTTAISAALRQTCDLLVAAGFEVRVNESRATDSSIIVARNSTFADIVEDILDHWPRLGHDEASEAYARAMARWQRKTAQLGLILGYPPLCAAAYAAGDGWFFEGEGQDGQPPWEPEVLAWWRALGHFRLGASPEALEEARAWVLRAARRFVVTFPDARRP
jgi:hypothetical protein